MGWIDSDSPEVEAGQNLSFNFHDNRRRQLAQMNSKPIETSEEHENALQLVATLMDAEPGSPEEQELDLRASLIERYERAHFPIEASTAT